MSHTPGPWFEHSHRQIGPKVGIVCEVWSAIGWGDEAIKQADANARLIAAAPELLEALQLIAGTDPVDAALDPQRAIRVARAAIAKATGEPK